MDFSISAHHMYANQTLDWLPMDTEILYKNNLETRYNDLKKYGWINNHFTYKFNSHGFRCVDFNKDPSVVFLGCSLTQGIGLPVENTWASIVANKINLQCFNLAVGGSSNDTAFRIAYAWLEKLKPNIVIFGNTFPNRLELLSKNNILQLLPNSLPKTLGTDFYNHWISCDDNGFLNKTKNTLAIENLCRSNHIKFVNIDATSMIDFKIDYARDLSHPGTLSNQQFADYVLTRI